MVEIISSVKPYLEFLYYISGILLAIGVIIGIWQLKVAGAQLKLMKKDTDDRNKRAAVQKAIDYLDWFASHFIPENTKYLHNLKGKKIIVYSSLEKMPFKFNDEVNLDNPVVEESIDNKTRYDIIRLMNKLEFFSAAFINGLADEELAFNPVSELFCKFVESNYDVYCLSRANSSTKFTYTIQMYELWKSKLHNYEIDEKVEQLNKEKKVYAKPKIIGE